MQLIRAQIKNFRSIEDTGVFEINDLTCLVGKNEAGKTAILEALYGQRPYRSFSYDKTRDYPRRFLTRFDERHPDGKSETARTWWKLSVEDIQAVEESLGKGVLLSDEVQVVSGIGMDTTPWIIEVDEAKCVELAIDDVRPNAAEKAQLTARQRTGVFRWG